MSKDKIKLINLYTDTPTPLSENIYQSLMGQEFLECKVKRLYMIKKPF